MTDYVEIGSTPANENCAQVGSADYATRARKECAQFIIAIRRTLGSEPDGARLVVRSNPHDFGTYYEVACRYDDRSDAAVDYAFKCDSDAPGDWTDEDRKALGL